MTEENERLHGLTRDEFLARFPPMADWIEKMEGQWGPFGRCGSLSLSGGRLVIMATFERVAHVNFHNPENGAAEQTFSVNLSYEALAAVSGLFQALRPEADRARDWGVLVTMLRQASDAEEGQ